MSTQIVPMSTTLEVMTMGVAPDFRSEAIVIRPTVVSCSCAAQNNDVFDIDAWVDCTCDIGAVIPAEPVVIATYRARWDYQEKADEALAAAGYARTSSWRLCQAPRKSAYHPEGVMQEHQTCTVEKVNA